MKHSAQCVLLVAVTFALALTFNGLRDTPEDPIPGTGPMTEPHPITLRTCAKEVIVRAVIDDGMSLPEAASLCGEMYALLPDPPGFFIMMDDLPADESPTSDEERWCRQVIGWVVSNGSAPDAVARLQAEFHEWRLQGTGRLPNAANLSPSPTAFLALARAEWVAQCQGIRFRTSLADDSSHCE